MWQSGLPNELLVGADGAGIRPVIRAGLPVEPTVLDDPAPMDRRNPARRLVDSGSSRGQLKEIASAAACAALDRLDLAIVLLQSDRKVLLSNPAARRAEARGDCFRIAARKLYLVDHHSQRLLDTFLSNHSSMDSRHGGPLCVSRRNDGAHCYFLIAEWLDMPSPSGSAVASLLIYEPHLAGQLSHELLAHLYGLTKMESRLVAALFVAPVLQTAADHCGIALNTAKTHLKHVFAKCGVCSKAELLRLLALGPRTL
jgi:hypothetical protein